MAGNYDPNETIKVNMTGTDTDKRLDKIEQQLDLLVNNQPHIHRNPQISLNDELDLRALWCVLWQGRLLIICTTFLFAAVGVLYALNQPNMYSSKGVYAPVEEGAGGVLPGQYGGLAAMAGISLGGGAGGDVDQALELLTSWAFIGRFIENKGIAPYLLAVHGWDDENGKPIWDKNVYSPDGGWLDGSHSSYLAYRKFSRLLDVKSNSKNGLVTVSLDYYSPKLASEWLIELMAALNKEFRVRDVNASLRSVTYLEGKIQETSIGVVSDVLYGMVEEQMKTLMLAELREEYLLSTVVSVKASEFPSSPRRLALVMLFVVAGFACGAAAAMMKQAAQSESIL